MNRLPRLLALLATIAAPLTAPAVHAHAAEDWVRPFHGGLAQAADDYHLELVIADGQAALYLYDRQNIPLPNDEFTGTALVWLADGSLELPWRADGRKRLVLTGDFKAEDVKRVIVTLQPPFGRPLKAWFAKSSVGVPATNDGASGGESAKW